MNDAVRFWFADLRPVGRGRIRLRIAPSIACGAVALAVLAGASSNLAAGLIAGAVVVMLLTLAATVWLELSHQPSGRRAGSQAGSDHQPIARAVVGIALIGVVVVAMAAGSRAAALGGWLAIAAPVATVVGLVLIGRFSRSPH